VQDVRFACFAPGDDPSVWRDGWYPDVAQARLTVFRASWQQRSKGQGRGSFVLSAQNAQRFEPSADL
jgi:hypothetical protein